jgi:hypothetical protein
MEIWEDILQQFYHAEGSSQFDIYLKSVKKIHSLEIDKFILNNLLFVLSHAENDEAIQLLKSYGINPGGQKLKRINKMIKQTDNNLRMKRADFQQDHGTEKVDVDFANIKDQVEQYKGFYLDPRKVTVREWIGIIKNMKRHGQKGSNTARGRTQPGNR